MILTSHSQASCLDNLVKDTGYTQPQITHVLMTCNNLFLTGQTIYLKNDTKSDILIRKQHPRMIQEVPQQEKAKYLLDYTKCEEIAKNMSKYMKKCEHEKSN